VSKSDLLRVGELAKAVGKTVRAIHLYEELGLVRPAMRTDGGFRLYDPEAKKRIAWIIKLQAIGFKLSEIQEFVKAFEHAPSGRDATTRAREVFARKQREIRQQITQLEVIENDLSEALAYLDACHECSPSYAPSECSMCDHQGHERGSAPPLFATLSRTAAEDLSAGYDVPVSELKEPARKTESPSQNDVRSRSQERSH
jgi:MerR family transcriptional regulator, copper efflux regulator